MRLSHLCHLRDTTNSTCLEANQGKATKAAAPANDPKKDSYIKELEMVVDELAVPHRPYASLDELKSKIAKARPHPVV